MGEITEKFRSGSSKFVHLCDSKTRQTSSIRGKLPATPTFEREGGTEIRVKMAHRTGGRRVGGSRKGGVGRRGKLKTVDGFEGNGVSGDLKIRAIERRTGDKTRGSPGPRGVVRMRMKGRNVGRWPRPFRSLAQSSSSL